MKTRNLHIDTLRGLACIFLVAYHVIGHNYTTGLKIAEGPYREINDILAYIRMPLFTFLSGIVYAYRPFQGDIVKFIKGKIRRLLYPMFIVGTLFAVIQAHTNGANYAITNWKLLHILPVGHFWFIESLFFIFLLMIPMELWKIENEKAKFFTLLGGSIILYLAPINIPYFSINGAIYLLPYFTVGMILSRYHYIEKLHRGIGFPLLFIGCLILLLIYFNIIDLYGKKTIFGLTTGMLFCTALLSLKIEIKPLYTIGIYSYSIYLFHVFFTASSRIIFYKLGWDNIHILLIALTMAGIFGPILTEWLFDSTNLTRMLFLGKAPLHSPGPIHQRVPFIKSIMGRCIKTNSQD